MTLRTRAEEQNWDYLGYLASNVRSVLIPLEAESTIRLSPRDQKYVLQGKKFFESAIAGCSSYSRPEQLFSIKDRNVPPAASALRIAVDVYSRIHATPPSNLEDLGETLAKYVEILDEIREKQFVPTQYKSVVQDLNRFLQAIVQKAIDERYRLVTQGPS
jgi:hypothetical protein